VGTYGVEFVQQKWRGRWDIRQAVARACKASARTICTLGAQEAIPWADEVDPAHPLAASPASAAAAAAQDPALAEKELVHRPAAAELVN
jgi:hypothetical protein